MVICQYYMQGRCKFGDKCYNEHHNGSVSGKNTFLKIDRKLYESLVSDVIAAEKGNQWPLSCYAPFRDHPNVESMKDTSTDELRQLYYQAKNDNQLGEYASMVSGLLKEADDMRKFLKLPSAELGSVLENILKEKVPEQTYSTFRFSTYSENKSGDVFGGTSLGPSTNIFCQEPTNIFSSTSDQSNPISNQSIFSGTTSFNQQQPNENIFSQNTSENIFGNSKTSHQSIFGNQNTNEKLFQPTASQVSSLHLFGGAPTSEVTFSQTSSNNRFSNSEMKHENFPEFQKGASPGTLLSSVQGENTSYIFGHTFNSNKSSIENNYSDMENLTNEERAMFLAPKFSFQKIPLHPPPEELCK